MDKHEATSSCVSIPAPMSGTRAGYAATNIFVTLLTALLVAVPGAGSAGQLSLTNSPLFLSVPVPSNIFFLHDDSGSMDWDLLTSETTTASDSSLADGVMTLSAGGDSTTYTYVYSSSTNNYGSTSSYGRILPEESSLSGANMPADKHGVWRARYHGYNKMYYNPDTNYLPWPGVDSAGNTLPDAKAISGAIPVTAVRFNPYDASSATLNLAANMSDWTSENVPETDGSPADVTNSGIYPARYYTWTDDGDSVVEAGDTHTLYEIRTSGCSTGATCPSSFTRASTRTDCTVSGTTATCTVDQELKNFANWFMYHHRRQQASKYAIGKVIDQAQSEVRMGHATINNNPGNPGTVSNAARVLITGMSGSWTTGNKRAIFDALYKVKSDSTTPLRDALNKTGKYFECVTTNIFGLSTGSTSCPILPAASGGTCQQNFTVLVTDGYWNDSFSGPGNTDTDGSGSYDGGAYADSYSNTLADVAMHYYERDLAINLSDQVPVTAGVDNATHQHMVTYGVAFGVAGTLSAGPTDPAAAFSWPNPTAGDQQKIDDLRHAAYNGRGQYLSAEDPNALASALLSTLGSIGDRTGSSASVAVNSRSLSTTTRLYQARFTSGEWSGDLRALAVNASGDVSTQTWSAKDQLVSQNWDTSRKILTRGSTTTGVAFRWTAINASQQADLNDNPATTTVDNDGKGENRLKWLRGDNSNEGTGANFRTRTNSFKLGDIVDSSPIFVGAPINLPDLETTPHSSFREAYVSRREMVYVGANDGMLHGFDAATGQEKIAYVPSMLFSNLSKLTNPSYTHVYYVNASPTVGDAYGTFTNISGVCASGCWRTVLAGGLGGGGKGIYALDITDPDGSVTTSGISTALLAFNENNAAKIALWEYTDSASGDMGYVYGQPTITKVKTSATDYAWAVIFGNGYNSTNENAVLYIVNAVTGALIRKIVLNPDYDATWNPTGGTPINGNGLSMPAVVDTNGDYVADRVYAGDLRGNMWRVDLTDNSPSNWDTKYKSGSDARPLFQAVDGSGNEQPITVQPEVGAHPDGQSNYMVYFGTGRYLVTTTDNAAAASPVQTFYGVWDDSYSGSGTPVTRAKLLPQTISTATVGSTTVRQVTNTTIQWGSSGTCQSDGTGNCLGWRDDLLTATTGSLGEKAVSNPVLVGGTVPRIIFTTLIPQSDACTAGGTSWLMELNPKNGGQLPEQVFDVDGNGTIDANDMIGGTVPVAGINPGIGIMPEPTILRDPANKTDLKVETGSSGAVVTLKNYVSGTQGGRQSWRQLK